MSLSTGFAISAYLLWVIVLWQIDREAGADWSPTFRLALWGVGLLTGIPVATLLGSWLMSWLTRMPTGGG